MIKSKAQDLLFIIYISRLQSLSTAEKLRLFNIAPDAQYLSKLSINDISNIIKRNLHGSYDGARNLEMSERESDIITNKGIHFTICKNDDYPKQLLPLKDAPFALFYKGNLSLLNSDKLVSIVGTRYITTDAANKTKRFAYDAVNGGCTVISGLANGVDGAAHSGALDAYFDALESGEVTAAKTVAVLPCSVDTVTPRNHAKMASDIIESGGCILSENTPLIEIKKWNFATRNRIIAALSPATVVTQAPQGSGALITAQYALEYKKALFFHTAAFSEQAMQVDTAIRARMEKDFAIGKVTRTKMENCIRKYIDGGAPVITSYEDYVNHMEVIKSNPQIKDGDSENMLWEDLP